MVSAGSTPPGLPTTIGRYQIVERLAPERHDDVYRGFDPMIERPLVVKVFPLGDIGQPAADTIRQTFFGEMQRTGMLAHPGITTLFDAGVLPGGLFMAIEYVDGASLADEMQTVVTWPVAERTSLLVQLANALDYAREQGVPHLHLRPSHVMIGLDAAPKIRGFGVAGIEDALRAARGEAALASSWSAPERQAGDPADGRADVFSLARIAQAILADAVASDSGTLAEVLQKAAASAPADRFQTVGDFKYAMLHALGLDELEVRMAWEATREAGNVLAADQTSPGVPHSAVHGDLTAMISEAPTQLTPSGVDDLMTVMNPRNADDRDPTKPA